ncbi:MAG TPA: PIG-L family deacetylase [Terriglobia bacterium]|nr:PIG-L family deacetylase [Terriglobia bacterium]
MQRRPLSTLWIAVLMLAVAPAQAVWAEQGIEAATDRTTYNVGSDVRLEIIFPPGASVLPASSLVATVRYAGESKPLVDRAPLVHSGESSSAPGALDSGSDRSTGYHLIWKIPADARTGRYEIDLAGKDPNSGATVLSQTNAASFAVHRRLVEIERVELNKSLYTPGDRVQCHVVLKNLTDQSLSGLRVEFSDRYWPWIAAPTAEAAKSIVALAESLTLPAGAEHDLDSATAGVAGAVKQTAFHQYGVVVWDHERKTVLDIAFSALVIIQPPGIDSPRPYPGQYLYPELSAVNGFAYRHFYPPEAESPAITFDHDHTMWAPGANATVSFALANPTHAAWHAVQVVARLLSSAGSELATDVTDQQLDLASDGSSLHRSAAFALPAHEAGIDRVVVEVRDTNGGVLASNTLELGVNPLPKSILIFCAHEDDEGAYSGLARAAIENHIPVHYVYFTGGDAGSCDRYYERSCDAADAMNFGGIRMQETVASLGHLGVSRESIEFVGLPDGASGMIWYDHPQPSEPFLDPLLATDHAPYAGMVEPNVSYDRRSVVEAAKKLIEKYQPDVICTAHPGSAGHIDHIVNNYFVVKALQELAAEGRVPPQLRLLVDHAYKDQPPTPYHYQPLTFFISGEAAALAQEAWWFYQSQGGNVAEGHLRSFSQLSRTEELRQVLDWNEHQGWNERR